MSSQQQGDQRFACSVCGQKFTQGTVVCPHDGTMLTPVNKDPLIGTMLAERYEVLSAVGTGGMGVVYRGRHVLMDRIVAIKMLHAHLIADPKLLQRFQQEAKACSQLSHPNVVSVFDFGISLQGQPYLVMDFLEGTALDDVLKKCPNLPVERAVPIFTQVCDGLGHAHQKGIIHRDLKPGNVVLVRTDETEDFVKIVDFGIAKLLTSASKDSLHLTKTGEVFGSPLYMSPEQCLAMELDLRADIYTMGCVMYETLTGVPPLIGRHAVQTLQMHIDEMPKAIKSVNPALEVPPLLEAAIFKAMAKKPEDRYQTMAELKKDLLAITAGQPVQIAPPTVSTSMDDRKRSASTPSSGQAQAKPLTWRRVGIMAAVLIGVVGICLGLWLAPSPMQRGDEIAKLDPESAWDMHDKLRAEAMERRDYAAAELNINKAIEQAGKLSEPRLRQARSLNDKGNLLMMLKRYSEAQLALEKAMAIRKAANVLDNPDGVDGMKTLARAYELGDKPQFAVFQYKQLLDVQKSMFGDDSMEVAKTLGNLAQVNAAQGKTGQAIKEFKLAWDIIQQHPNTTDSEFIPILEGYTNLLAKQHETVQASSVKSMMESMRSREK